MSRESGRQVLMIAYFFPPVGGGGVQRSIKFVKYLPEFGWRPRVLTVREPYDFYRDDTFLEDVPQAASVHRTASLEPMKWVRKYLKKKSASGSRRAEEGGSRRSLKPSFLVKLKTWLFVPDNEILWFPFAFWRGWRLVRRGDVEVIYSTASPFTDHLIAWALARVSGLPWVADFRDLWVDRANFPAGRWRSWIDRKLENGVLRGADHVVGASPVICDSYRRRFPEQNFTTITNGYDEADFRGPPVEPSSDRFLVTYTGIFNRERRPDVFLRAMKRLAERRSDFREKARLRIIGQLDNPGEFDNHNTLAELELGDLVEILPYQPHEVVIGEMRRATLLFLMIGDFPGNEVMITGKVFEYLRAKRPILALAPERGALAEILESSGGGRVVSNTRVEDVEAALEELFDSHREGSLRMEASAEELSRFDRRTLTRTLASVFDGLVL